MGRVGGGLEGDRWQMLHENRVLGREGRSEGFGGRRSVNCFRLFSVRSNSFVVALRTAEVSTRTEQNVGCETKTRSSRFIPRIGWRTIWRSPACLHNVTVG